MAALPTPPPSPISKLPRPDPPFSLFLRPSPRLFSSPRLAVSARLLSSRPSSAPNASLGDPHADDTRLALPHPVPVPVFVTLPPDAVGPAGKMSRRKTMAVSFMALAAAGVEGVAVEAWWGLVERDAPGLYDWSGYLDLVALAQRFGLKVRVILAFHQSGSGPDDPCWFGLPRWVLEEMELNPDLQYSDRFGRRSKEYISLGCDMFPVLKGRTPIQAYSDFMRNFRDTFKSSLGVIITEVQIGMGPGGDLRYPFCPSEKLSQTKGIQELGEFQCYDKYMLASLNACAVGIGKNLGTPGPLVAGNLLLNAEDGSWNTPYGHFFLEWYSTMLLVHGERLSIAADAIFWGSGARILAKIAGVHWHYATRSRSSELMAGYYNTGTRDGYLPIARMFSRYRMALCCACFDLRDNEGDHSINADGSAEGVLRQLVRAARMCNLPLAGENSVARLDEDSLQQVVRSSRMGANPVSFNFVRMNKNMFESQNWNRFTRFVRQMSDGRPFQARLDVVSSELCFPEDNGRALIFKRLLPCQLRLCSPCS
ncbi:beta-amylase 3, chloroplastic-like [Wolffia australiana]